MELSEFIIQPRGPYQFDRYIHPTPIQSRLGSFTLDLTVEDAATRPPDKAMVDALDTLAKAFLNDQDSLVKLVHQQYLNTEDEFVPKGLSTDELEPLLDMCSIGVSEYELNEGEYRGRVYMSPEWDQEHGMYFARIDGKWEQVDC